MGEKEWWDGWLVPLERTPAVCWACRLSLGWRCTLSGRQASSAAACSLGSFIRGFHLDLLPGVLRCFGWLALWIPVPTSLVSHIAPLLWAPFTPEFLLAWVPLVLSLRVVSAYLALPWWLSVAVCRKGKRGGMSEIVTPISTSGCRFVLWNSPIERERLQFIWALDVLMWSSMLPWLEAQIWALCDPYLSVSFLLLPPSMVSVHCTVIFVLLASSTLVPCMLHLILILSNIYSPASAALFCSALARCIY